MAILCQKTLRTPSPEAVFVFVSMTALTTYFSYGFLFAFGQLHDFFRKIFDWCRASNLQVSLLSFAF